MYGVQASRSSGEAFGYVIGLMRHYMAFRLGSMGWGSSARDVAWVNLGSGLDVALMSSIFGQSSNTSNELMQAGSLQTSFLFLMHSFKIQLQCPVCQEGRHQQPLS